MSLEVTLFSLPDYASRDAVKLLTRLLGPVAEAADLVSDRLRLARWRAATKTLNRAAELASEHGINPQQVPLKFLIPFLEHCSLEDDQDLLIDRWASLLLSASKDFNSRFQFYSYLLSRLGPEEIRLLDKMFQRWRANDMYRNMEFLIPFAERYVSDSLGIVEERVTIRDKNFPPKHPPRLNLKKLRILISGDLDDQFVPEIRSACDENGGIPLDLRFLHWGGSVRQIFFLQPCNTDALFFLESFRLLDQKRTTRVLPDSSPTSAWAVELSWMQMTTAGYDFVRSCTLDGKSKRSEE